MSKIALKLIHTCLETKETSLDLGNCGLTDSDFEPGAPIDIELRKCKHLESLILSDMWYNAKRGWVSNDKGDYNYFTKGPAAINELQGLLRLECASHQRSDWGIADTFFVSQLHQLQYLNLRGNKIHDLEGLKSLSVIEDLNLSSNGIKTLQGFGPLHGVKKLNLSGNYISTLDGLEGLISLRNISLVGNEITNLGPLKSLVNLEILQLQNNGITDLKSLRTLTSLEQLNLSHNQIGKLVDIEELNQLTQLSIDKANITSLKGIEKLLELKFLNVSDNRITSLKSLEKLSNLITLIASRTYIKDLRSLEKLPALEILFVSDTKITSPEGLEKITTLRELRIRGNTIRDFKCLESLHNLINLDVSNTGISSLTSLQKLTWLKQLNLSRNNISDISGLETLTGLMELDISFNKIKDLSPLLPFLTRPKKPLTIVVKRVALIGLGRIHVAGNPLENPPLSIVELGNESVLRHFEKIKAEGIDYLYEAKLTLVGEGNAGKTSLQKRLMNAKAALPTDDTRTRGIEVVDWKYKGAKSKSHIAHIWDFGGQDVYYPVHRFFLTENSVFVLLASTRQNNHHFDYWIPTIAQFGGKSPIILGQTCHQGNKISWTDLGHYLINDHFNIIKAGQLSYTELNLQKKNEGLEEIKKIIVDQIEKLPHYGKGVPKSWIPAREAIAAESTKKACISFEEFMAICRKTDPDKMSAEIDIMDFARFLHSQGIILWYSGIEELRNWVILQPEWAMNAVYKIIDDEDIQKRRGHIIASDFERIWREAHYKQRFEILKKLLQVFKIAFPKKHNNKDFIIPARLLAMPKEARWENDQQCLRLIYKYEFMPKGLVNQLSADLSKFIKSDGDVWNDAVNIEHPDTAAQAQVIENFYERTIEIKTTGKDARGLNMMITAAMEDVTKSYKGVHYSLFVPCSCGECINSNKPEKFEYQKLLKWSKDRDHITCNESQTRLSIDNLLFNVGLASSLRGVYRRIIKKEIRQLKTFISYSKSEGELAKDTNYLQEFKNRLAPLSKFNNTLITWDDTNLIPGEEWDDRIREELNTCDVIFLLISPAFLNTKYIRETELNIAMERQSKGECMVVPVVIRNCAWTDIPLLSKLSGIPRKNIPIASWKKNKKEWPSIDDAWQHVYDEIKKLIQAFYKND
ncbi:MULTISPECIES: leucine-rich repeat domain-containing protein [Niastella]|uniref:Leucine-rich repeat domain-containing protein n=1 Tax=Niastella soli TaxID=2821487 RepID=A0ABS3YYL5_9BACT|nr:leucine-rich repeat domain-containing protein [Niastella soli]MBO9203012.1 leucine-rich repeat domain-containing protein [Niastella soli]